MGIREAPYFLKWFILGIILGLVAGSAAAIFYLLLHMFEYLFLIRLIGMSYPHPLGEGGSLSFVFHPGRYYLVPIVTALGGFISGFLVYTFAPEAEGHGTDAAIRAFHYLQGKIRPIVVPVKILASAITIGSGGSAGREGPTAQFAAGIGSLVADLLHLPPEDRRISVAVGIGAGIGAIFKTPMGGAILATEILYKRDLEVEALFPAIIASGVGYLIFGSLFGFTPIFGYYTGSVSPAELPMFIVLGAVTGLMGILYPRTFYYVHSWFKRLRFSNYLKPVIGGFMMGIVALLAPQVLATGYGWVNLIEYGVPHAFYSPILPVAALVIALPFLKILATSLSIGSGGSGGVFAPGLDIGAFTGAVVGLLLHVLFPGLVPNIAPFVILGMVGLMAAAGKIPLAITVMVMEMTGYDIRLLPAAVMVAATAYLISGDETIYRSQLPTRRDSPAHAHEYATPVLRTLRVSSCRLLSIAVTQGDTVEHTLNLMREGSLDAVPVIDDSGALIGLVYLRDIINVSSRELITRFVRRPIYVTPEASLEEALSLMGNEGLNVIPVVGNDHRFLGLLTLSSIGRAYREQVGGNGSGKPKAF